MSSSKTNPRILALFDVDGTLTVARKTIEEPMIERLKTLRNQITIGVVGGSDLQKQKEQLGQNALSSFDYNFAENGLIGYKNGVLINETSILDKMGNDAIKSFVSFVLKYIADLDIPVKRGTFVEFRSGMINVSPVGRNCSREERNAFELYDKEHNVRQKFVQVLRKEFEHLNLQYSIGGQISFDVFPAGWDKTYCLRFLNESDFDEIHFFGDKTYEGGNDYEIFSSDKTIGHTVSSPEDTLTLLDTLFPTSDPSSDH